MEIIMVYPRQEHCIQDEKMFETLDEAKEYLKTLSYQDELTVGIFTLVKNIKLRKETIVNIIEDEQTGEKK